MLGRIVAKKTVVLFDLFHTLTSVETACPDYPGTSRLLGVSAEAWSAQQLHHSHYRLVGQVTDSYEIVRRMAHAIDPTIPESKIRDVAKARKGAFDGSMLRVPDESVEVLRAVKAAGKRIGLVSNADASEVDLWSKGPLAPFFDAAVFSCHVGSAKPDAGIYLSCIKELDVDHVECVFVGDGGSDEMNGAARLGMTPVQYRGLVQRIYKKPGERKPGAEFVIDSWAELLGR